jgi:hypothetical protein
VEPEPLLHRSELLGTLWVIADIGEHVKRIKDLLEEALNGEEPEDDS